MFHHSQAEGAMGRLALRLVLFLVPITLASGCSIPTGPQNGYQCTLYTGSIGTGEQAITPRNDESYSNGEPMDHRTRR
jgi:hypothetical protein